MIFAALCLKPLFVLMDALWKLCSHSSQQISAQLSIHVDQSPKSPVGGSGFMCIKPNHINSRLKGSERGSHVPRLVCVLGQRGDSDANIKWNPDWRGHISAKLSRWTRLANEVLTDFRNSLTNIIFFHVKSSYTAAIPIVWKVFWLWLVSSEI